MTTRRIYIKHVASLLLIFSMLLNLYFTLFTPRSVLNATVIETNEEQPKTSPTDDNAPSPDTEEQTPEPTPITIVSAELIDTNKIHYTLSDYAIIELKDLVRVFSNTNVSITSINTVGSLAICGTIEVAEQLSLSKTYTLFITGFGECIVTISPTFNTGDTQEPDQQPPIKTVEDYFTSAKELCEQYDIFTNPDTVVLRNTLANGAVVFRLSLGDERALIMVNPTDNDITYELLGEWYMIADSENGLFAATPLLTGDISILPSSFLALVNTVVLTYLSSHIEP